MGKSGGGPQHVAPLTPPGEIPQKYRRTIQFLEPRHLAALDQEIMRRKAHGEDRNEEGVRINVNRSMLIRELIDGAPFK